MLMKTLLMRLWLVLFAFSQALSAEAQVAIDMGHYAELFRQHEYVKAFDEAYALRNKAVFGKTPLLSYIMAKALCCNKQYGDARLGFDYILKEYSLNKAQKVFLIDEMNACSAQQTAGIAAFNNSVMSKYFASSSGKGGQTAIVSGKLGYLVDCSPDTDAYKIDSTFIAGDLSQRLFLPDEAAKAADYYEKLLGAGYHCFPAGDILIVTSAANQLGRATALKAGEELDRVLNFYYTFYHIRRPDKLITVLFANNKAELQSLAGKLHGLTLSKGNIAYSSLPDLTIVGIAGVEQLGTIKHELFHLAVRSDIGDIPAWLDEGVACLYETSHWEGDILVGDVRNWRTEVLSGFVADGRQIPSIKELSEQNWEGFLLGERNSPCDVAFRYAVVKHLAIFLQQRHLLQRTLEVFKTRVNVLTDTTMFNKPQDMLLQDATGETASLLQSDFNEWLEQTCYLNHRSAVDINLHNLQAVHNSIFLLQGRGATAASKIFREGDVLERELEKYTNDPPAELLDRIRDFFSRYQQLLHKYDIHE